jgi:hypothetical protein
MPAVLLAGLLAVAQTAAEDRPLTPEKIRERVRTVIDQGLPRATTALRGAFADRLSASLLRDPASEQLPMLLEGFPKALEFHTAQVQIHEIQAAIPGLPPVQLPQPLLEEGYQLQMDYLTARLDRVVRVDHSPAAKQQIAEQIRTLTTTARDLLRSKLPGEDGGRFVDRETEGMSDLWLKSLNMPYNQFMDAPLPKDELDLILGRMKDAAEPFAPRILTEAQLKDPALLQSLGVSALFDRVTQAASGAMASCYRDLGDWSRRFEEWTARATASRNEGVELASRNYAPPRPDPAKAASKKVGAESTSTVQVFPGMPDGAKSPAKHTPFESPPSRRTVTVIVIGILVVLATIVIPRRSKTGS